MLRASVHACVCGTGLGCISATPPKNRSHYMVVPAVLVMMISHASSRMTKDKFDKRNSFAAVARSQLVISGKSLHRQFSQMAQLCMVESPCYSNPMSLHPPPHTP